KSNSFVILYNIEIDKVNDGYSISESNKKFNKEAIISEYDTKFKTYMLQFFKLKFENTSDGTLLFFDKFEECNKIFEKMQEFIIQSKEFLKQNKIRFRLKTAVCLADTKMNKSLYLPKLVKLITISIPNKIMSLGNFKAKYELLKEQPYKITGLGDYSLGSDTIEVYTLER
ncbi:hypothetical protein IKE67_03825, partial [bacterium]|nr:hypothetical protein [bacterium]